jgi:hypothetical protein
MYSMPTTDNTLGAILIGGLSRTALYGFTIIQTGIFFHYVKKDSPLIIKASVSLR